MRLKSDAHFLRVKESSNRCSIPVKVFFRPSFGVVIVVRAAAAAAEYVGCSCPSIVSDLTPRFLMTGMETALSYQ